jgi:hypothetical protein
MRANNTDIKNNFFIPVIFAAKVHRFSKFNQGFSLKEMGENPIYGI